MLIVSTDTQADKEAEHEQQTADGVRFLQTLFEPEDLVCFRPIESWTENGKKLPRVDWKGIRYDRGGLVDGAGKWVWAPPSCSVSFEMRLAIIKARSEQERTNVFFGVCPRYASQRYDLAWQIRVIRVLWSDVDHVTVDEALQRCGAADLPQPSILVNSGNGAHLYWLLTEAFLIDDAGGNPVPAFTEFVDQGPEKKKKPRKYIIDQATQERLYLDVRSNVPPLSPKAQYIQDINAGIASKIGGDHTTDLSRLLRVPGTLNRKDQRNGREPVLCTLVECDPTRRYPIQQFDRFVEVSPEKVRREQVAKVKLPSPRKLSARGTDKFNQLVLASDTAAVGCRSEADFALCCWAVEHGMLRDQVWSAVANVGKFAGNERYFDRTWDAAQNQTREKILNVAQRASGNHTSATRDREPSRKPEILLGTDEHRVNDEAIGHLAKDENVFQRGSTLCQIVRQRTIDDGIRRALGAPTIGALPEAVIRERLTRHVTFAEATEDGLIPKHPPVWCTRAIAQRGYWDHIRPLTAIVSSPVLRPDGTILQHAGYDEKSGLYLTSDVEVSVPEHPTRREAFDAAGTLLDLVCDFPFARPEHRSAWLALLLTPVSRYAFYGPAPLVLVDANVRGSGKTMLCELVSVICFGRDIARMSNPADDDEARKRITALAIAGDPLCLIDNIEGRLGGASLDSALTATVWKDRILGESRIVELPLCVTWCASGNNVMLGADTTRRTLHIRLESSLENPELREDFKHADLMSYALQNRPALLSAALTVLRAFCDAGRPKQQLPPWGSFMAWSSLVREAIVWCGLPDPAKTRQELAETADTEASALRELLDAWPQIDPDNSGVTTAELLDKLGQGELADFRHALVELCPPDKGPLPTVRQLGNRLGHVRGRVIGGRCLDYRTKRGRQRAWYLRILDVPLDGSGDSGDSGDSF